MSDKPKRRFWQILLNTVFMLLLVTPFVLATDAPAPLWDGNESVADYAKRVNLPPTKTLDLGNGMKLELVLIPAGKFLMGTRGPMSVDEDGFQKKIVTGQALLAASAGFLLVMLAFVVIRAIQHKRRPQLSLGLLLLVTVAAGGCVLSGLHWRHSVQTLEKANAEYAQVMAIYYAAHPDEKSLHPAHLVTLTQPFYMGKYAVTQEQYQAVTGIPPSCFIGKTSPSTFLNKDNPVDTVSWEDAQVFCKTLSRQMNQAVRLPTEAEWEYACRAGTKTTYHSGDSEADLARVAWYGANSKGTTHPVGQKEANNFGLYDMHGNVWQWCQNWYGEYGKSEAENPQGPAQGDLRMLRGGAWNYNCQCCRSATRMDYHPVIKGTDYIGFRVVLVPASRTP